MKNQGSHFLSKRLILAYVCFFGYFCQYLHRTNLSLAIVCMVKTQTPVGTLTNRTLGLYKQNDTVENVTIHVVVPETEVPIEDDITQCSGITEEQRQDSKRAEFTWDKTQVTGMLSSYYYGVVVTQVLGGWAAIKFGGKKIMAASMTIMAVCSLATPGLTRTNLYFMFILRALIGLAAGTVSPSLFAIWTKWAPPNERGTLLNISLLGIGTIGHPRLILSYFSIKIIVEVFRLVSEGGIVGTVVSFSTSGLLCAYGFDNGWGSIFYIHGVVTVLFILIWLVLASDSPAEHPSISEKEKEYIIEATGTMATENRKDITIPWKSIVTSPAVIALAFTQTCFNWSNFTLLTTLPLYMKEVLKFDIKQNGILTSLPHICNAIIMVVVGVVSDVVTSKSYLSITAARRLFQGICFIGLSVCLFTITFITCEHKVVAVVMLCVGTTFLAFCQGGYYLNAVDFAPRYSGVVYGLTNSISCITGTVAPLVAGILTEHGTRLEWNNVFYVCIGVSIVGTLVFSFFSRGEIQDWAKDGVVNEIIVDEPEKPLTAERCVTPQLERTLKPKEGRLGHLMISPELMGSLHSLHSLHSLQSIR